MKLGLYLTARTDIFTKGILLRKEHLVSQKMVVFQESGLSRQVSLYHKQVDGIQMYTPDFVKKGSEGLFPCLQKKN